MNYFKIIAAIILCFLFVVIFILPDNHGNLLQAQLDQMPVYNFADEADIQLKKGNWPVAVTMLDTIIDSSKLDNTAARRDKQDILDKHLKNASYADRLSSYGWLSVETNPNSWNSLTAKGVADFFIFNDSKKLSVPADGPHKKLMSNIDNLLVVKELWADSPFAAQVMKVAITQNVFTAAYFKEVSRKFELIEDEAKLNPVAVKQVLEIVAPNWQLLKNCKTWYQYKTMMRYVESSRQLQFFINLTSGSFNKTEQLVQVLTILRGNTEQIDAILSYLKDYGEVGLQRIYSVITKGPQGVTFITNNPGFEPSFNSARKSFPGNIVNWWEAQLFKARIMTEIVRHVLLWLIGVGIIMLFVPDKNVVPTAGALLVFVCLVFVFHIFAPQDAVVTSAPGAGQPMMIEGTGGSAVVGGVTEVAKKTQKYHFGTDSILALLIIIFLQGAACYKALGEFKSVKGMRGSYQGKLHQLDNVDIFFDLPLYLGLLGTISSFIIMLFNPDASRIVAYSSTIVGIIISASLRVFYLYPLRKEFISNIDFSEKNK